MPPRKRFRARPRERRGTARLVAVAMLLAALAACGGEAPLPGDPLRVASARLPDPILGEPYRADVVAVGGLRPYSLRLEEGSLPPGIALQSGVLVGTPTELGRYEFTIAVSDANLASTFETFTVSVRDVPVPRFELAVPDTEVRDTTVLRGRIEDARKLRAVRLRLRWGDLDLTLPSDAVTASRSDVALFWEPLPDGVAIDLAFLGEPYTGSGELFELAVTTDEATRLGFDMTVEALYSDRHAYDTRRLGGRSGTASPGADADEPETDPTSTDPNGVDPNGVDPNDADPNEADPNEADPNEAGTDDAETGTP